MKNIFKIFVLINVVICLSKTLAAQQYQPFPTDSAQWSVSTEKYTIMGDTLINSLVYQKYYYHEGDSLLTLNNLEYYAALREDSNKRVYYIPKDSLNELLLYDFNIGLGSYITVNCFNPLTNFVEVCEIKVTDIDSVEIGTGFRKRFKLESTDFNNSFFTEYWIEGIGSSFGIFSSGYSDCWVLYYVPQLLCFEHKQQLLYNFLPEWNCFHQPGGGAISEANIYNSVLELWPNPVNNEFIIHIKSIDLANKNLKIIITNSLGQVVDIFSIKKSYSTFNCQNWKKGTYFITLFKTYQIISNQIILKY